jgi:hypothetical protein
MSGPAAEQMSVAKSLAEVLARVAAASTRAGRAQPVRRRCVALAARARTAPQRARSR